MKQISCQKNVEIVAIVTVRHASVAIMKCAVAINAAYLPVMAKSTVSMAETNEIAKDAWPLNSSVMMGAVSPAARIVMALPIVPTEAMKTRSYVVNPAETINSNVITGSAWLPAPSVIAASIVMIAVMK